MWTNQVLLNVVIPLWLVQATDAPHWAAGVVVRYQHCDVHLLADGHTSRGVKDVLERPALGADLGGFLRASSCLITMATHGTAGLVTIFLVWLGHVAVTGAELYLSGASWAFQAKLMDPGGAVSTRGPRSSATRWAGVGSGALHLPGDALGRYRVAADRRHTVTAATVGMHYSARAAQRFLHRNVPAEELAAAGATIASVPPPSLLEDPPLSLAGDGFGPTTVQR